MRTLQPIAAFFLLFFALIVSAQTTSQPASKTVGKTTSKTQRNITLNVQNEPITLVLDKITKQSAMEFAYSPQFVDMQRKMTLKVTAVPVGNVLTTIFPNNNLTYGRSGTIVYISPSVNDSTINASQINESIVSLKPKKPSKSSEPSKLSAPVDTLTRLEFIEQLIRANLNWKPIGEKGFNIYSYTFYRNESQWVPIKGTMAINGRVITLTDSTNKANCYRLLMGEAKRDTMELWDGTKLVNDNVIVNRIDQLGDTKNYMFKFTHDLETNKYWITLNEWNNGAYIFLLELKPLK